MRAALLVLGALPLMAADYVVANRPVVNMFSKATEEADVVSQAIFGTNAAVVDAETPGWLRIRTPDQYTGWARADAFTRREQPYAISKAAAVVNLFAHIYRDQSVTRHQPLLTVPFETRLELGDQANSRWLQVQLPDGRTGWVQSGDVALHAERMGVAATIELAKRFMGLPYTWGGTSSYGYDCSGFTQMLMRSMGAVMPRDAHDQAEWDGVTQVDKSELQAGDLLFFGPSAKKITHTGMYIGEGQFIHATTHIRPVVQISRLADEHWTNLFVAARRLK